MRTILGLAAAAALVSPAHAQTVGIGSLPQGTTAYAIAAAVARVASDKLNMRARVVPQGGPVVTLPLANQGRLDFTTAVSVVSAFAYQGRAMFKGRPQKNVRVVAVMRMLRVGFYARKDTDIKSMADLKGKRLPSGFFKQRIAFIFQLGMMSMYGLTMKDVTGVPVPNNSRSVQDLIGGKIDALSMSMSSSATRQADATVGIRYLSLDKTPAAVAKLHKFAPGTIIETVKPGPLFPGVTGPTNVLAAPFVLVAGTKTPDDMVYKLVKALHDNKKLMVSVFKGLRGFNPDRMYVDIGVPYHAGAMRYYKEMGQVK
jgi:TRAP transporter TAXI family solute receptor